MIVKFKVFVNDPLFKVLEKCSSSIPYINRYEFEYIHKSNGIYFYIGKIERLKIIKFSCGLAEMEIVILKHNEGSSQASWGKIGRYYGCATKNDICNMRGWPLIIGDEKMKKIILQNI